jgi:hypothetical protein
MLSAFEGHQTKAAVYTAIGLESATKIMMIFLIG